MRYAVPRAVTKRSEEPGSEHEVLSDLIERIEEEVRHERPTLYMRLEELGFLLERHFRREEREGGLFALVLANAPWEEERVRTLRREHGALLASIDFLQRRGAGAGTPARMKEIACFIALLRAHEISEGVLYQASMARTACG